VNCRLNLNPCFFTYCTCHVTISTSCVWPKRWINPLRPLQSIAISRAHSSLTLNQKMHKQQTCVVHKWAYSLCRHLCLCSDAISKKMRVALRGEWDYTTVQRLHHRQTRSYGAEGWKDASENNEWMIMQCATFSKSLNPRNIDKKHFGYPDLVPIWKPFVDMRIRLQTHYPAEVCGLCFFHSAPILFGKFWIRILSDSAATMMQVIRLLFDSASIKVMHIPHNINYVSTTLSTSLETFFSQLVICLT